MDEDEKHAFTLDSLISRESNELTLVTKAFALTIEINQQQDKIKGTMITLVKLFY